MGLQRDQKLLLFFLRRGFKEEQKSLPIFYAYNQKHELLHTGMYVYKCIHISVSNYHILYEWTQGAGRLVLLFLSSIPTSLRTLIEY